MSSTVVVYGNKFLAGRIMVVITSSNPLHQASSTDYPSRLGHAETGAGMNQTEHYL